MANQLSHLLAQWHQHRDESEWVLGTVYKTEGPCYRKPGAMMLFNSLGQQFGMLSGGCLESDIQQHARRVMQSGKALTLCYDGSDEDDLSFQLGIGCGGTVHILLQPIRSDNQFLRLDQLHQLLSERRCGYFYQRIADKDGTVEARFVASEQLSSIPAPAKATLLEEGDQQWLVTPIVPDPHLLVVGGGIDARPLVSIAHQLGWKVSLWDPRPANARREFFMDADRIPDCSVEELSLFARTQAVDAAVLMTHNILLDASALKSLQDNTLKYLAILGPESRRDRVLTEAKLTGQPLKTAIAGPAGLDIGAELPESIALSILAECHASLRRHSGHSLSGILGSTTSCIPDKAPDKDLAA
ncbi:XdhC family protein [Motiliproteus sp. MSK22-1]|uniref:XdhC family protein n=1 Tax=Motiliproteus sp. MSK22-1 TaxID=1897630 RepID=UPI0009764EFC|nr:XdhC/CoxI family protein [Motiliproteus sp. MSK22-1]OMH26578.1 isoquinoline 1-oxidoreductase [Motiliproteus sp. MSK22-1]